jgi:hypothetical protein
MEFINENADSINRFIQLQTDMNGYYNRTKTIDIIGKTYGNLTLKAITDSLSLGILKMAQSPVADEIRRKKRETLDAAQIKIANASKAKAAKVAAKEAAKAEAKAQANIAKVARGKVGRGKSAKAAQTAAAAAAAAAAEAAAKAAADYAAEAAAAAAGN